MHIGFFMLLVIAAVLVYHTSSYKIHAYCPDRIITNESAVNQYSSHYLEIKSSLSLSHARTCACANAKWYRGCGPI